MSSTRQKATAAYYTPPDVISALVKWAARRASDRLLDPSCGDGRFIALRRLSFGVEQEAESSQTARERAPGALIHEVDFFAWAARTTEHFACAAGNPPFIRFQGISGNRHQTALSLCSQIGVDLSALTSSWAPLLPATGSLLKPGGRTAFIGPPETGHATCGAPALASKTRRIQWDADSPVLSDSRLYGIDGRVAVEPTTASSIGT